MDLNLKVVEARDLPKMDVIGSTDGYCVINVGSQTQKTRVIDNTKNPRWDQTFRFPSVNQSTPIQIRLYDHDSVGKDEQISVLDLNTNALAFGRIVDTWYSCKPVKGNKKGGDLHLVLHLCPSGAPAFVEQAMPPPGAYPAQPGYPPQAGAYPPGQPYPGQMPPQPGMYAPAQPAYPQQPGYPPQQGYPPQPGYAAPPPGYVAPQPGYAAPPPGYAAAPGYPGQYMDKDQRKAMKKMEKKMEKAEKKMEKEAKKALKKMYK